MGNKSNGSDSLKKEIENKNIIVKNLVNYYPKKYLIYIGCKNHTFFFGYRQDIYCSIEKIVIQQQFSLNRQSKVLKKWCLNFRKIAFMNKSHEFIALHDKEIANWEINSCFNLTSNNTLFNFYNDYVNFHYKDQGLIYKDSFQLQLGAKDDWIVAGQYEKIIFLQKVMEGQWILIDTMKIDFVNCKLNESGNILIVLLERKINIYIQNNFGEWRIAKEMNYCEFCFMDQEQFVVLRNNIITIWQVKPQKLEVVQLQQLKFDLIMGERLFGINYMKQNQLLISKTRFAIYFIKKKNEKFYFQQQVEIQKELLVIGSEWLFFNIPELEQFFDDKARSRRIEILKIHEN